MRLLLKNKKGFTLIELLVVIAIISLLSSVVLASLNSARAKARDARRIADIREMQKALELYYDENGSYPSPIIWQASFHPNWQTASLASALDKFMPTLPTDPIPTDRFNSAGKPYYAYMSYDMTGPGTAGRWYAIFFILENKTHPMQQSDGVWRCDGSLWDGSGSSGVIIVGGNCI